MPNYMAINELLLGAILALRGQGLTQTEIAQKMGVTQGAISRCLERYRVFGPITHRKGNGRHWGNRIGHFGPK